MTVPPKRRVRLAPADRRRQLLDAALRVVVDDGFDAVTVEAVTRRAGVTRPMVYDLFGDLDGLLRSLVEREQAAAVATLAAIVPERPDGHEPDELLVACIAGFLDAVRREPRTWRLMLLPPDGSPRALRDGIAAGRRRLVAQVSGLLEWGLRQRGGPPGIDHELLARLLIAAAENAARLSLAHPRRFPPARFAAAARGMLALLPPTRALAQP